MNKYIQTYDDIDDILTRFGIPSALAGGAVRDTLLNSNPKDLDIFICKKHYTAVIRLIKDNYKVKSTWKYNIFFKYPLRVYRYFTKLDLEVNKIILSDKNIVIDLICINDTDFIKHVTDGFDFNICKVLRIKKKFIVTPQFVQALYTKIDICTRENRTNTYRVDRMRKKFPDILFSISGDSKHV